MDGGGVETLDGVNDGREGTPDCAHAHGAAPTRIPIAVSLIHPDCIIAILPAAVVPVALAGFATVAVACAVQCVMLLTCEYISSAALITLEFDS